MNRPLSNALAIVPASGGSAREMYSSALADAIGPALSFFGWMP